MTATPQAILDLVERFSSNSDLYRSPSSNETQARREFIDPFFAALHKQLAEAKELLQRQIDATDGQIDRLVYELYGLTEEEIGIVEETGLQR